MSVIITSRAAPFARPIITRATSRRGYNAKHTRCVGIARANGRIAGYNQPPGGLRAVTGAILTREIVVPGRKLITFIMRGVYALVLTGTFGIIFLIHLARVASSSQS